MSRPTPAAKVIPFILRELASAGVPKSEIRFVVGPGSHRPLTDQEIATKIGTDVAAKYEATNHDFLSGDLRALGSLDNGMPIYINRIVADADFKICVGGIYPHSSVGFTGGAKLIVPGVSGFATIFYFHTYSSSRGPAIIEGEEGDEPDRRACAELAAKILGLDAIVNMTLNTQREISGVFLGDFVKAHRAGARFALETYSTPISETSEKATDLVVANCYPLDSDAIQLDKALAAFSYFQNAYTLALYLPVMAAATTVCTIDLIIRAISNSAPNRFRSNHQCRKSDPATNYTSGLSTLAQMNSTKNTQLHASFATLNKRFSFLQRNFQNTHASVSCQQPEFRY